jgi:hypothetical protein
MTCYQNMTLRRVTSSFISSVVQFSKIKIEIPVSGCLVAPDVASPCGIPYENEGHMGVPLTGGNSAFL